MGYDKRGLDPEVVERVLSQLKSQLSELDSERSALNTLKENIKGVWTGPDAVAFDGVAQDMVVNLMKYIEIIEQYKTDVTKKRDEYVNEIERRRSTYSR